MLLQKRHDLFERSRNLGVLDSLAIEAVAVTLHGNKSMRHADTVQFLGHVHGLPKWHIGERRADYRSAASPVKRGWKTAEHATWEITAKPFRESCANQEIVRWAS